MAEEFKTEVEEREELDLGCDHCGAKLVWDPEHDALACDHCGTTRAVERLEDEIQEYALADIEQHATGLGLEVRATRCENCGAQVAFEEVRTADVCVFCGSANVLAQSANRHTIRPESVIPLDVGQAAVEANFKRWLKGLWFRPNALKRVMAVDAVGIYLPAWTFDANVHSAWTADSGTYYYVTRTYTTMQNGKPVTRTRRERRVRWRPAAGQRDDEYDDLQVLASHGVPADKAQALGAFDTSALVPYRGEYLAGWFAEEYRIDLAQGWASGQARIHERQRERCAGDIPGDTYRRLSVRDTLSEVRWKHVLFPIWSATYAFGGKQYPVWIHGQTGNVVGEAPLSWVKISLAVVVVLLIILALVVFAG